MKTEYKVGDVIVSEKVMNGVAAVSPLLIFGQDADGKFKLAREDNTSLKVTLSAERLAEYGYSVISHVDAIDQSAIKPEGPETPNGEPEKPRAVRSRKKAASAAPDSGAPTTQPRSGGKKGGKKSGAFYVLDSSALDHLLESCHGSAGTKREAARVAEGIDVVPGADKVTVIRVVERLSLTRTVRNVIKRI